MSLHFYLGVHQASMPGFQFSFNGSDELTEWTHHPYRLEWDGLNFFYHSRTLARPAVL
jgi:hypothetical protein